MSYTQCKECGCVRPVDVEGRCPLCATQVGVTQGSREKLPGEFKEVSRLVVVPGQTIQLDVNDLGIWLQNTSVSPPKMYVVTVEEVVK